MELKSMKRDEIDKLYKGDGGGYGILNHPNCSIGECGIGCMVVDCGIQQGYSTPTIVYRTGKGEEIIVKDD